MKQTQKQRVASSSKLLFDAKVTEFMASCMRLDQAGMTRTREECHMLLDHYLDANDEALREALRGMEG